MNGSQSKSKEFINIIKLKCKLAIEIFNDIFGSWVIIENIYEEDV